MTLQQVDRSRRSHEAIVRVIGVFKLLKGLFLAIGCIAALRLIHEDVGNVILEWAHRLHVAPGNQHLQRLLAKLSVSHHELKLLAIAFAVYSAMFLTEGTGLLLLKPWAEKMTVFTTAGLIPFEIYEIARRVTALKLWLLVVNVAIVIYLIRNLHPRKKISPNGT
ncbi:MAG: DUF2127 domain-containing protein [Tepidisphaeraceae bacterium]|jgi:uncharacterized membrane protein (DUF2068 family)